MPNFDKTGPQGQGPMTGRGFGPCSCGMGWKHTVPGRGLGRYCDCKEPQTKEDKLKALADYKKAIEEELEDVKKEEEVESKGE